jgi:hypothetical protein
MTKMTLMQKINEELKSSGLVEPTEPDCFGSIVFDATNTACIACVHKMACEAKMSETKGAQMMDIETEIEKVETFAPEADVEPPVEAVTPTETVDTPVMAGESSAHGAAEAFRLNRREEITQVIVALMSDKQETCKGIRIKVQELMGLSAIAPARFSRKLFDALVENGLITWDGDLNGQIAWL